MDEKTLSAWRNWEDEDREFRGNSKIEIFSDGSGELVLDDFRTAFSFDSLVELEEKLTYDA